MNATAAVGAVTERNVSTWPGKTTLLFVRFTKVDLSGAEIIQNYLLYCTMVADIISWTRGKTIEL